MPAACPMRRSIEGYDGHSRTTLQASRSGARGVWVATILCAQATCERVLAALVSLRELPGAGIKGPKNWEKWGLGTLIKHVRAQGWVPEDLLDEVEVLQR